MIREAVMMNKAAIAIDIGTTTLEAVLVDENGRILRETARPNGGAAYGADVMSRIRAAVEGAPLQEVMRRDLTAMIGELLPDEDDSGHDPGTDAGMKTTPAISYIVVAGNTTMLHILRGYDCSGLARYPYTPVSLAAERLPAGDVLPEIRPAYAHAEIILMPGISGFVGADIAAGLYAEEVTSLEGTTLFLDLGTNGEMALIRHGEGGGGLQISVCSTAAGPVFEGAGIQCGCRGVPGAISGVVVVPSSDASAGYGGEYVARCRTIGQAPPVGICGSGVLEAVAELARYHIIDENGLLSDPWFREGFLLAERDPQRALTAKEAGSLPDQRDTAPSEIRLYQEDVRAVQLAKAAIRAGAETLPLSCGMTARAIDSVLVAGAFGTALNFSRLEPLGLLPPGLTGSCRSVGNTSLKGAVKAAVTLLAGRWEALLDDLAWITSAATEIPLAGRQDFEACFLSMMGF